MTTTPSALHLLAQILGSPTDPDPESTTDDDWWSYAVCNSTDPEAFFPEKGSSTREARKVCLSCPVRGECLEWALDHGERFGVWGGLSEGERRKLSRTAGQTADGSPARELRKAS